MDNMNSTPKRTDVGIILLAVFAAFIIAGIAVSFSSASKRVQQPAVEEMEYHGHKYIIFTVSGRHGQTFVHDPDCPCHNRIGSVWPNRPIDAQPLKLKTSLLDDVNDHP